MSSTLDFTQELIRRASVSPDDAGCQELLVERLAAAGFESEIMRFGEVTNLWARRGTTEPLFCFAGHTDVVPAGPLEEWSSDPFGPDIRDGQLYGRGSADMKAALAAMVDAAVSFVGAHPDHRGSIGFLITSDEEGRARDGTRRVMAALAGRAEIPACCLIGEPSCSKQLGDTLRIGRRGSLSGMLTVHGEQGHVAYPQFADNPIARIAPVIAELYATPLDQGNEFFPPSSFQVVRIASDAGAPNVIPGSLQARFNIRYSTVWSHQKLRTHIEKLFSSRGLDYELSWHLSGEPFLTPVGHFVEAARDAVSEHTGIEPELSTGGGTSDGRFIAPHGVEVVEFGAVNTTIHKANETIPVADIDVLREVYGAILQRMLA